VTAEKSCSVDGCGKSIAARGKCSTHYQQERRFERGEGREPGKVKQIAKPGEALDQVTFKLDAGDKAAIDKLATAERVDASDLYREAVEMLLAQRKAKRDAAARFAARVEGSTLFARFKDHGEAACLTEGEVCELFEVVLESSADTLRGRVKTARELLTLCGSKKSRAFLDWIAGRLDSRGWTLLYAA
jgi:predicted transcriptional regulator